MRFFLMIAALFIFSCENIVNNGDNHGETEINDIEVEDSGEIPDDFSLSFKSIKDNYNPYGDIIFGDTIGNLYYSRTGELNTFKNEARGQNLLKLDIDGGFVWQAPFIFPSSYNLYIYDYTLSEKTGAVYITGSGTFDGMEAKLFLIKIDADGVQSWVQFWGTTEWSFPFAIDVDSEENIYVAGGVAAAFEGEEYGGCDEGYRCYDAFVTKWTEDGAMLWTKQSGMDDSDIIRGLVVDNNDNIYLVGTENMKTEFSSNGCAPNANMFLQKWDSDGNEIWKKTDSGTRGAVGKDLDLMGSDIVVFGHKCSDIDDNVRQAQLYLKKYHYDGEIIWEKDLVDDSEDGRLLYAIKVHVSGSHIFTAIDAWDEYGSLSDVMFAFFDKNGEMGFSKRIKTRCQDYPEHITSLPNGGVMITGISDGWIGDDITTAECESEQFRPFVMTLMPSINP